MTLYWAEWAWLGRVAGGVLLGVEGDRLAEVAEGVEPPTGAERLEGLTLPGLADAHSHAFHRALRGRTHRRAGDFWEWRQQMYEVAARLEPDSYFRLARAAYAELALAGVTAVGEFHYLHHRPDGKPYEDPNAMGESLLRAAEAAGIRITLLDTCYLRGGFDRPLEGPQLRFGDGSAQGWAERAGRLAGGPLARVGAAVHSVRAVDPPSIEQVAAWAGRREAPLHFHLSEQPGENRACLEATGMTPTRLLAEAGALGPHSTAVHATHLSTEDVELLGGSRTRVCLCPTTERDLADGVGPAAALAGAGSPLCLGTDSHAVADLLEEARLVELHQRLTTGRRGHHRPADLLRAATEEGMASLGWPGGRLAEGAPADFVTLSLATPRMAGWSPDTLAEHVLYASTAAEVTRVVVAGQTVVEGGRHLRVDDVAGALGEAISSLLDAPPRTP